MTDSITTAQKLLQIQAVQLQPDQPFTWASGWKSPIYCDNRKILSYPFIRDYIKSELCNLVFEEYPNAEIIAGVATAGIPWGAFVADQLKLPLIYVRPKPKEHGLGNQIEGYYKPHQQVVVVEDLISTGKSSLQVVNVLREAELNVLGMVSIFNYGFRIAADAFQRAGVPYTSLTDYPTLIHVAKKENIFAEELETLLLNWREDPENWSGNE